MQIDSRIVKRLGIGAALIAMVAAGTLAGRAQQAGEPLYRVSGEAVVPASALRGAIDPLFEDSAMGETRALLVMRDGEVVAERYAPGFGPDTKLLSWSMGKSVTAALVGLMVADGRLALDAPVPVPAWSQPGDPRGAITLRQLLTMTSGLDHVEDGEPVTDGDTVRMLFMDGARDMAAFAEAKPLAHQPGSDFSYSTGNTLILADLMTRMLTNSDDPDTRRRAMQAFIDGRLKAPGQIPSLTVEYDAAGTMIGGSMMHMTARDYGRFGELLRRRGRGPTGHQILPEKWIDMMTTPSRRNAAYGLHVWLNREGPSSALMPGQAPASLFGCVGHGGQYILVSPSQRLTVVRIGLSPTKEQRQAVRGALAKLVGLFPG